MIRQQKEQQLQIDDQVQIKEIIDIRSPTMKISEAN